VHALARTLDLYPQFAYARFEMALLEVARGQLITAEELVREGVAAQDPVGRHRFPAIGLHWLLGLLRAAQADHPGAHAEFDRELAQRASDRIYGPEYIAAAHVAKGQLLLADGDVSAARHAFDAALTHIEDYPAAWIGLSAVHAALGHRAEAASANEHSRQRIAALRANRRAGDFALFAACDAAVQGDRDAAIGFLDQLISDEPPSLAGWSIPIEPFLRPLHGTRGFSDIIARLAARAR
jgi:tetratricopeptide (TPR) repeat protein